VRAGAALAESAGLAGDRHRRLPGPQPLKDLDYLGGFRAGAGRGHRGGDRRADRGAFGAILDGSSLQRSSGRVV
jgi:hypothetical protein